MLSLGLDIGGSSVKAALLHDGRPGAVARSDRYERPGREALCSAIAQAAGAVLEGAPGPVDRLGLCAPGLLDRATGTITKAVNLPGILGLPLAELVAGAVRHADRVSVAREIAFITTDAHATAFDIFMRERLDGRLLCLALGTGVGACVLDNGVPLHVSGETPGHIGQIDVSLDEDPPIGPDSARGTLESYVGMPALVASGAIKPRDLTSAAASGSDHEFDRGVLERPLRALARAIRVCHALYRPGHVRLAGGVGVRLGRHLEHLDGLVRPGLTSLAIPGWTLACGTDDFHAARGVARLSA